MAIYSQLCEYSLGARDRHIASRLKFRICDLAVVDYHGVPRCALALGPADALGELCAGVGEEELW